MIHFSLLCSWLLYYTIKSRVLIKWLISSNEWMLRLCLNHYCSFCFCWFKALERARAKEKENEIGLWSICAHETFCVCLNFFFHFFLFVTQNFDWYICASDTLPYCLITIGTRRSDCPCVGKFSIWNNELQITFYLLLFHCYSYFIPSLCSFWPLIKFIVHQTMSKDFFFLFYLTFHIFKCYVDICFRNGLE